MKEQLRMSEQPSRTINAKSHSGEAFIVNNTELAMNQLKIMDGITKVQSNATQLMKQEDIEEYYIRKMSGGKDGQEKYGGLCGGWVANFIEGPNAAKHLWGRMRVDMAKEGLNEVKDFEKIMKYQHYMMIADGDEDSLGDLTKYELSSYGIAMNEKVAKFKQYVGRNSDKKTFSNTKDLLGSLLSSIRELNKEHCLYIGSPGHHMAVWYKGQNKYIVCETLNSGIEEYKGNELKNIFESIDWKEYKDYEQDEDQEDEDQEDEEIYSCWVRDLGKR
ncbi:hypothetical protein [Bacteroides sp. 51]|uniref:hypothetical protein n=1 Tax=Bacteroides sp. 51 TaxID=2302938 RepID=UPI0013D73422|nr:hypothetical protein [Bacteroides sp. 51]NDV81313.1 hypothetical protein [Bacteroides sp. 51]